MTECVCSLQFSCIYSYLKNHLFLNLITTFYYYIHLFSNIINYKVFKVDVLPLKIILLEIWNIYLRTIWKTVYSHSFIIVDYYRRLIETNISTSEFSNTLILSDILKNRHMTSLCLPVSLSLYLHFALLWLFFVYTLQHQLAQTHQSRIKICC